MSRVLLVGDDVLLTKFPTEYLAAGGLNVYSVPDGGTGIHETLTGQYNVVVLGSMMLKVSGLGVLKNVRSQSTAPVIMLTTKSNDIDRIIGLEVGANNCVPKPYTPRELLIRIGAIPRRAQHGDEQSSVLNSVSISNVVLHPAKRRVTIRGGPLGLASTEFNLLEVLICHAGQVISKETLFIEVLGHKLTKSDRSIDVHIFSIRHKLGDVSLIQAVHGLGYLFVKS